MITHAVIAATPWWAEFGQFFLDLYYGLPWWAIPIYVVAFVMIVGSVVSIVTLWVQAARQGRVERQAAKTPGRHRTVDRLHEREFLWVFLVPALNEEVTIADSVTRLSEVRVTNRVILVINDGSDDATASVLASLDVADLTVLHRTSPEARQGKSEALNAAWRHLHQAVIGPGGTHPGWSPDRVIVSIIDADGRIDRGLQPIADHFSDTRVGGVQALVRIYNRHTPLTWAQDVEFGVFGWAFQRGRMLWGTANMGGNGQFNRLAALDSVVVEDTQGRRGPWASGRLTEDQDIGLRLIGAGWRGMQSTRVSIHQQGLNQLGALYRQRTRWAQGGWQELSMIGSSLRNRRLRFAAHADQLWYLLTPIVQAWVGVSVVLSAIFLITGLARPHFTVFIVVLFYLFTAGPGIVGVLIARRWRGVWPFITDILLAHLYLIYSWLIYPVVYRALLRQISRRRGWAKTKREAIRQ